MISRRSVLVGGTALSLAPASAHGSAPSPRDTAIGRAAAEAIRAGACPGVCVAIGTGPAAIATWGFGKTNLETDTAVTDRSVFRIGSLTKQFTAAAVLRLAQSGRLDVRAAVSRYLPAFAALPSVSLLELMNQTAGVHSDESDAGSVCATPAKSQLELATDIARQPKVFDFAPGTAWLYSNANYVVLGAVVEQVTGKPFAQAMTELVFAPLDLGSLAIDTPAAVVPDRVSGYSPTGEPSGAFVNAAWLDVSQAGGAGAMRDTAADLCRWHQALLGGRLLDTRHLALMLAPGRLRDGRRSGAQRFSADDAHYGDVDYACGVLVSGPSDPRPSILHYGGINGFASLLQTYTTSRTTFAVLCNGDTGPGLPFHDIRQAVIQGLAA